MNCVVQHCNLYGTCDQERRVGLHGLADLQPTHTEAIGVAGGNAKECPQ